MRALIREVVIVSREEGVECGTLGARRDGALLRGQRGSGGVGKEWKWGAERRVRGAYR